MPTVSLPTPIGPISIEERKGAIARVRWQHLGQNDPPSAVLKKACLQIEAYFAGELMAFDLPLVPRGSPFQKRVWRTMCDIPHGETWTYGELAARVSSAARSVGGACGANPIPIIIPCHRVVAANGIGGYSGRGGLKIKFALLDHENRKARLL